MIFQINSQKGMFMDKTLCISTLFFIFILWGSSPLSAKILTSSQITPSTEKQCTSISVLPYFRMKGECYVALYMREADKANEYSSLEGERQCAEKSIAQTSARIFFPMQQHKNIRIGSIDWNSPNI